MKCYRVYVDGECVGTYFNLTMAVQAQGVWFGHGEVELRIEKYEY